MSARQPFFSARPETAQGFNQKAFSIDASNPLHTSQAISTTNESESMKAVFSVPGPFSGNSANGAPRLKTSGLSGMSKKKSAHNLKPSQPVEKDRKGSLNSRGFLDLTASNVRPGTADPHSKVHQDRVAALEARHGYQNTSRRSLDTESIVRPGTAASQSRALPDYAAGLDIRAPIPKPAALTTFLSHDTFSNRIPENDTHITTTQGASRKIDDVGDLTFHASTKGSSFNQIGPQRVPIEQQFGQYNISEVDLNASHEVTADGRVKMSAFTQIKKRNREEIEEDGEESYWVENQVKRHKSRHCEEFETRGHGKSPPFSPRPESSSRASHRDGDVRRHFPDARGSPQSSRYSEHRPTSPANERHTAPYELPQAEQATLDDTGNAFDKLLGRDTDTFMKQNMEKYNRMVKKWSECTEEEWMAGGKEIAEKYVKLISYVKDSMIANINDYANINVDIDRHFSDLGEREQLLDAVKKKLIVESGNALG